MHCVVKALHLSGYRLRLTFEDGATKDVDLAAHLTGEIFLPLRNPQYFKRFLVDADLDTVVWGNGADFSPDFLYEQGVTVRERHGRPKPVRVRARAPRWGQSRKPAPQRPSAPASAR